MFALIKDKISPRGFVKICIGVSGLWFLILYPVLNVFYWDHLPRMMRTSRSSCDFSQYYSGALVARHGMWDALYPKPIPAIYSAEPEFQPLILTPLFKKSASRRGEWNYYPQISAPDSSIVSTKISMLCDKIEGGYHYAYPPPLALILRPLALLNYKNASDFWFAIMCFSYFGISIYASRIFRDLKGEGTYTEGFVALLPIIPTLLSSTMSTTLAIGNVSPLLGFMIAWGAYSWNHNRQLALGVGILTLVIFKGIALSWCPLLLLKPLKKRTILTLVCATIVLNGFVLFHAGVGPYQLFFTEILPKANLSLGVGLQGLLKTIFGINPKTAIMVMNLILLGIIYLGYWLSQDRLKKGDSGRIIYPVLAATMAIFCICNPIVWPHHYFVNYLQLPFAGWILWEANQARGMWKNTILIMFALSMLFWCDGVFLTKNSYLMEWIKNTDNNPLFWGKMRSIVSGLVVYILPVTESLFILALAYRRLFLESKTKSLSELSNRYHISTLN